eukprot:SAG31_NODE_4303_length_3370_cov_1.742281_5_plen_72_part_00
MEKVDKNQLDPNSVRPTGQRHPEEARGLTDAHGERDRLDRKEHHVRPKLARVEIDTGQERNNAVERAGEHG